MRSPPPSLTLPLKGGGEVHNIATSFPLPLEGGGWGGGDARFTDAEHCPVTRLALGPP